MARTAPSTYTAITDAATLALQPMTEATHEDLILNGNHIYLYTLPLVVDQDTISYVSGQYCSTDDHAGAVTGYEDVLCYVLPVPDANTGQTLGCAFWAAAQNAGDIQVTALGASSSSSAAISGASYTRYSLTGITLTPGVDTIVVSMRATDVTDEIRMSHFSAWLEPGSSPLSAGPDNEDWFPQDTAATDADDPLPTHMMQRMAANAEIVAARGGHCMAWSADIRVARSQVYTEAAVRATPPIPVRYGPLASTLRIYANASCDNAGGLIKVWTQNTAAADGTDIGSLPTAAAWGADKTGLWVTGTLDVPSNPTGGHITAWAQAEGATGEPTNLWGLCIWEES